MLQEGPALLRFPEQFGATVSIARDQALPIGLLQQLMPALPGPEDQIDAKQQLSTNTPVWRSRTFGQGIDVPEQVSPAQLAFGRVDEVVTDILVGHSDPLGDIAQ